MTAGPTAGELLARLRVRYCGTEALPPKAMSPKAVVLSEVCVPAVYPIGGDLLVGRDTNARRIDAVAVNLWASDGYTLHGHEIKVSRSDLLTELADPAKAQAGQRVCDAWWLVLASKDLLRPTDELPPEWGVLVASGGTLRRLRAAVVTPATRDPQFVASLLSRSLTSPSWRRSSGYREGYRIAQQRWGRPG